MSREVVGVALLDLGPQSAEVVVPVAETESAGDLGDVRARVVSGQLLGLVAGLPGLGHHPVEAGELLLRGVLRLFRATDVRGDADQRAGMHEGRSRVLGLRGAPGQQPGVVGRGLVLEDAGPPVALLPVPARLGEEVGARLPVPGPDGGAYLLFARVRGGSMRGVELVGRYEAELRGGPRRAGLPARRARGAEGAAPDVPSTNSDVFFRAFSQKYTPRAITSRGISRATGGSGPIQRGELGGGEKG